jgi:phosphatidylserine/phosphatidylglycerophosphate/cardiolipin synthase-like enzyme
MDRIGRRRQFMADQSVEITLSSERNPADALVEAFAGAERRIDAAVYKFNLRKVFEALEAALDRGVAVRLVVDKWLIEREEDGFTEQLAKRDRGAAVKKWTGGKLHVKLVVIDGRQVLSGSYNWTKSAKNKNTELLLHFKDPATVRRFAKLFEDLWQDAEAL